MLSLGPEWNRHEPVVILTRDGFLTSPSTTFRLTPGHSGKTSFMAAGSSSKVFGRVLESTIGCEMAPFIRDTGALNTKVAVPVKEIANTRGTFFSLTGTIPPKVNFHPPLPHGF